MRDDRQPSGPVPPALLEIEGLVTEFTTPRGPVRAVDGLDLVIAAGETVAIVGESGCGKSVTSLSVLRLIPPSSGGVVAGRIRFEGEDLLAKSEPEMRAVRGNRIAMIFQEPMTALNPVVSIGRQIAEPLVIHEGLTGRQARRRTLELLRLVQIPDPERRIDEYPHQLSGGQRQRVMIAMALACRPRLLIADEPTTALDVTIQAQVLDLVRTLKDEVGAAVMIITHDLGVVAEVAERVAVMYAGRKVEEAPVERLFDAPQHPYTQALMRSMPHLGASLAEGGAGRLTEIPGVVPQLLGPSLGCAFAARCPHAEPRCRGETPAARTVAAGHLVACHLAEAA